MAHARYKPQVPPRPPAKIQSPRKIPMPKPKQEPKPKWRYPDQTEITNVYDAATNQWTCRLRIYTPSLNPPMEFITPLTGVDGAARRLAQMFESTQWGKAWIAKDLARQAAEKTATR